MFDKLTYSKKITLLMGGFLLFIVIAWQLVFAKTIRLYKDTEIKKEKLTWLKEKEKEIPAIQSQMNLLNKAYRTSDSSSIRDQLNAFISDFSENNHCWVTEIPEKNSYHGSQLDVQTNQFVIKGSFHELLKLLNAVETNFNYSAKVVSVKFYSLKDLQSKKTNLFLKIITQSFRQENP
jgi:hypothetical protein